MLNASSPRKTVSPLSSSSLNATHYSCLIGNETVTVSTSAPSFLIIGSQKGGTTSLFKLLTRHPNISIGRGKHKIEVHYFDKLAEFLHEREEYVKQQVSSKEEVDCWFTREYASHFPQDALSFDKTPSYMYFEKVPELLERTCPWKPKLIMVLRDPVTRAYSHYNFERKVVNPDKIGNKTFEFLLEQEMQVLKKYGLDSFTDISNDEWIKRFYQAQASLSGYVNLNECFCMRGMYWIQILKWKEYFEDLLVLNHEELYTNAGVMNKIYDFLGLPSMRHATSIRANKGSYDEDVANETRKMLQDFFKPHNHMLARVVNQDWDGVWDYNNM